LSDNITIDNDDDQSDNKLVYELIKIDIKSDENFVDFGDDDDDQMSVSKQEPLSYIMKIGTLEYQIDFNEMKQINIQNHDKQRIIKRIEIPNNITNIISYIKNEYEVIGISGAKF